MRLTLTPRNIGRHMSGNVVAEVPGSDPSAGIVVVGGHLDSWDLGTGAIDNAAGVAITTAAAHRIMQAGRPRRTIRVVLFGAEEVGGLGGEAHFAAQPGGGQRRPGRRIRFRRRPGLAGRTSAWRRPTPRSATAWPPCSRRSASSAARDRANAGADLGNWAQAGTAAIDLNQDGTRYFDYHHTPDDTLDKVDPAQLRQNVAAWTAMLAAVADAAEAIAPVEATP